MTDQIRQVVTSFELFNEQEQAVLQELSRADKDGKDYPQIKGRFLELLYKDLLRFYKWETSSEDRTEIRKRLIRVSGLFFQIPIGELRAISHKAKLSLKKIVYDTAPNPLEQDPVEIHAYDLKYISGFSEFFSEIQLEIGITALDYISGNRDKRIYPHSQFIVFRKKIQNEVTSQTYLTASAEPLTQTQLISLYNPDETKRDFITIGFDLVYESAFIDFFYNAPQLTPVTLSRNAHIMGHNFLLAALERLSNLQKKESPIEDTFPVYFLAPNNNTKEKINALTLFLVDNLIPQVADKIRQWNLQLRLDVNNFEIYW